MARKSKQATAESRASIIEQAARLFRTHGYDGTSLEEVMRAAGLTVGTFYAHFHSKAELFRAVLEQGNGSSYEYLMPPSARQAQGRRWLSLFLFHYLSERHRDSVESGCFFPSLAPDVSRLDIDSRRVFEATLKEMVRSKGVEFGRNGARKSAEDYLLAAFCMGVGAVALSRAMASKSFSRRILDAARKQGRKQFERRARP